MQIDEYNFPDDLYFHKEHYWAKVDGDVVIIGVSDFAQKLAGTIKRVVTLEEEDEIVRDKPIGTLSSGKWTGKLYAIERQLTRARIRRGSAPCIRQRALNAAKWWLDWIRQSAAWKIAQRRRRFAHWTMGPSARST